MDVLAATAAEIRQKTGGECHEFKLDVKDPALISTTVDDILSPNAIKAVVDIVLMGSMNVTTTVCRRAIEAKQGCTVLSISTPYARHGGAFVLPSAVSKAGVENMTRSLSSEWAKYGMRFNVIAPGPVGTEGAFSRLSSGSVDDAIASAGQTVPVGRIGYPEEVANLAAYICSDYASWMNGAIIDFDGGQQFLNHNSSFGSHLHELSHNDWQEVEDKIRQRTGKPKSKV
ncbi:unnamed protein product [Nippostrongylus brasiliensis]|uniref:2,4-dienoyl-CoA reductase, mitochondrial (inferred by orthology to a human protein) n=1 Tax=Nippostrongylus brasiliensis TaxID=27835 RepID=A0A0N4YK21_NIPBR|nr:unnamed protein product [Nippostrongylus brasiliensis]